MDPASRAGRQFIGGAWTDSTSQERVDVIDPAQTELIAQVCAGSQADIDAAVASAVSTQLAWAKTPVKARADVLRKAADALEAESAQLAELISREVGTPIDVSRAAQVGRPIQVLRSLCDATTEVTWVEQLDATLVAREPAGVVAAITPWNFPLHQVIAKVGAALLAGCTVVLKPSELAPLSAYAFADALADVGLPPGVFNVVTGRGAEIGQALVSHPNVDQVSFTGSTGVGRQIAASAAQTIKRISLELGGKGPSVVLSGADTGAAAVATAARCFTNSGQVCAALSRLLVPTSELDAAEGALAKYVADQQLGDPLNDGVTLGPVISEQARDRIQAMIAAAQSEGARLVAGGLDAPIPHTGWFVAPTVLSDVASEMTIAQTEVFGPVLCVMPYESVDEAVEIANGTPYGLVAAVWGPELDAAAHFASRIKAGMVGVNGGRLNSRAPFGGYKQSGIGREFGTFGIEEFLELKSLNFAADAEAERVMAVGQ